MNYEKGKSPIIKGLSPGLTEVGKIKIGKKGDARTSSSGNSFQMPQKLDHFLITTLERDKSNNFVTDEALCKSIGISNTPKEIPITLLFDDIELNFQCRYVAYKGKTLFCSGDGEFANQLTDVTKPRELVTCPCHRYTDQLFKGDDGKGNGKCKMSGKLSVMITGAGFVGGIWAFRTTSYNSNTGILSSLAFIKSITGGLLAGIPLMLTIQPKVATTPTGESTTIQVVGVRYAGSISDLQNGALQLAKQNSEFRARLVNVEPEMRKLISVDRELDEQGGDIREEFHPETPSMNIQVGEDIVDMSTGEIISEAVTVEQPKQPDPVAPTPTPTPKPATPTPTPKPPTPTPKPPTPPVIQNSFADLF